MGHLTTVLAASCCRSSATGPSFAHGLSRDAGAFALITEVPKDVQVVLE